jgi:Domain of unknown function (DUF4439)
MTLDECRAAVVRGEDAAVYAYSIAGARVPAARRAQSGLDAHRAARDTVASTLQSPPDPAPAYALPTEPASANQARELMAYVDNALVPLYADLAAASTGDERRRAVLSAQACATRAVSWGAASQAFPSGTP